MSGDAERPSFASRFGNSGGGSGSKRRAIPAISQSMQLPARFTAEDDSTDLDVCTAGKNGTPFNMNQSLYQVLTAATSNIKMSSRFDDDSDDSDDSQTDPTTPTTIDSRKGKGIERKKKQFKLAGLPLGPIRAAGKDRIEEVSDEEDDPVPTEFASPTPVAPVESLLEAQKQMNSSNFAANVQEKEREMFHDFEEGSKTKHLDLGKKLVEIFNLPGDEEVVSQYPCWLLKSVLLQGYMYITTRHICFYAYLPRKDHVVLKSGYLSKRGKSTVKFTRYWFILKGDVLSYYTNPSELYFPNGNIDLRYGLQANVVEAKDPKDSIMVTLSTDQRKYYFRADSAASAKEWVKSLQKVIFRSHNEGDSVKISIPVENVIEVEESPVLEFADTFKLKVFENDDTYAIDEYFFSFFSFGKDALDVLRSLVENSTASKIPKQILKNRSGPPSPRLGVFTDRLTTPVFKETVRATLVAPSPKSPSGRSSPGARSPRLSGDFSRGSFEMPRRSADVSREKLKQSTQPSRHSTDLSRESFSSTPTGSPKPSFSGSMDQSFGESSSGVRLSLDDDGKGTASGILDRSDVFDSPSYKGKGHGRSDSQSSNKSRRTLSFVRSRSGKKKESSPSRVQSGGTTRMGDSDSETELGGANTGKSSPRLQDIAKLGNFPLQRAASWAGWMKKRTQGVGTLLATESMGYLEKVSDMWVGGKRHYEPMGMMPHEEVEDAEDEDGNAQEHGASFRARFALPPQERLSAVYFGYLHRVLPLYGKIYLSNRSFCFRSILPGTKTKMILPLKDIENVGKEKGFRFGYSGLVVTIRGHEELFFEFGQEAARDDCAVTLLHGLSDFHVLAESGILTREEKKGAEMAKTEYQMLQDARQDGHNIHDMQLPTSTEPNCHLDAPPIVFDDPHGSIINFKPAESMLITCLTIGTRGDVQPFIALCIGLMKDGHRTRIATHAEYGHWIESYGIEFRPVEGDPGELMALCVEYGMFTVDFMKVATGKMRGWLDGLLLSSWEACKGSDLLLESPSAMAGIHIAEALGIPYFRAFTMPWTRTRAYPHAFAVPEHKMGGAYNYFTYVIIDNVFWKATAGQVNRWRKKTLNLTRTSLDKLQPNKVPFLYNFSPSVVIPPLDYSDWIRVTGYWFLDSPTDWTPSKELTDFIKKARTDGKKLVYVGFGSVTVADPAAMTRTVVDSVIKADVRCILSKGWSDRLQEKGTDEPEVPLPAEIHQIKQAPHDWLFKQIDAAVHHGGAGTTGASLRAGIPTIIKPFFGDQYFFGQRVEDLGVGICVKKLNVSAFSRALWEVTHNERMITKAEILGGQIRKENGVETAIQAIYRDMEYARTLIKKQQVDPHEVDSEESWTFVEDSDPDQLARLAK